jgi:PAS domain S-box-containing protein
LSESNSNGPSPQLDLYRVQVRELSNFAMFAIDPNGILLSWNAGVEQLFGYSEQEWIGQHAQIIFTPAEKAQEVCQSELRKADESGSVTDIRWHRRRDGTEFFAYGFMNALRDDAGRLIGFTKVMSDETARKQLQDSLTESNAALEQFAYVASHDLQEPLRTMSTFAELLSKEYAGKLDAGADRYLSFIRTAAQRMSSMVQDLLSYARAKTEEDRPVSVALDEDLEAALTHLTQAVEESGGCVTHDPMPTVEVDRGKMVRLFQNLIGNALKYRKPDVPVKVHVSAEQKGDEWVISVEDNGIGFDPVHGDTIFVPFKRLHAPGEYSGSGVGLAICRRIVESQGGRIWGESKPGEGSTFRFTLPLAGAPRNRHTPPLPTGGAWTEST